jgi:hypothetical protein
VKFRNVNITQTSIFPLWGLAVFKNSAESSSPNGSRLFLVFNRSSAGSAPCWRKISISLTHEKLLVTNLRILGESSISPRNMLSLRKSTTSSFAKRNHNIASIPETRCHGANAIGTMPLLALNENRKDATILRLDCLRARHLSGGMNVIGSAAES